MNCKKYVLKLYKGIHANCGFRHFIKGVACFVPGAYLRTDRNAIEKLC